MHNHTENRHEQINESPIAMQIIVKDTKDFTELELCHAVGHAVASYTGAVRLSKTITGYYTQWSLGEHRKVVRRARGALWEKLLEEDSDYFHYASKGNKVEVLIVPPLPISEASKNIRKAQVSGLVTLPDTLSFITHEEPLLSIYTNSEVPMSPGKRAAAVGHISQLMLEKLDEEDYHEWLDTGFQIRVSSLGNMKTNVSLSSVFVQDNGHTEVAPGTITAMGTWAKNPPLSMETFIER